MNSLAMIGIKIEFNNSAMTALIPRLAWWLVSVYYLSRMVNLLKDSMILMMVTLDEHIHD